ncbi:MAG: type III-A CRISPR-associated protein Cas10/Csm1, partial [Nitrospinota bacterium]
IKGRVAKKFLFVSGDLSGIQSYIFNLINTKYNAKILRARSFELDAFSHSTAKRILKRLGLPHFCRIMNAGGRFILLLPNTGKVKETLRELRLEIESFCLSRYFGELSLNISEGVEASGEELSKEKAADLFLRISADVAEAKQKKLQTALGVSGHVLSREYGKIRGNENVCEICVRRAVVKENLCKVCSELVSFGGSIPKAKYLAFAKNNKSAEQYPGLSLFDGDTIYALRKEDEKLFSFSVNRYSPGLGRMNIPYFLPSENGEVVTFEKLAEKSRGVKKIAMFKADVDNLGGIFSLGFKNRISISRYASLSRMLNYFFSGWVNHSIETCFSNIYTVFSGGDDLCVIGPWTEIIDFAMKVEGEFKKFSAENRSITISGGIVLAGSSLPVRNIAANAEEELEKSKKNTKNRISLFDTTVLWKDFERLKKFGEELFRKADEGKISEGLVYRLLDYGERNGKFIKGDVSSRNGLWRAHFRYDVFRNVDKENKGESKVRDWLLEEVEKNIGNIRFSASYALYS